MSIVVKKETTASIATPASGKSTLFIDSADEKLKRKTDAGTVVNVELGAVSSFNGRTGAVVPLAGDYVAADITNIPAGNISSTFVQDAINELDTEKLSTSHEGTGGTAHAQVTTSVDGFMIASDKTKLDGIASGATANSSDSFLLDRTNHTGTQDASSVTSGSNNKVAAFNNSGVLSPISTLSVDATTTGLFQQINYQPNNLTGYTTFNNFNTELNPLQDSPDDSYNILSFYSNIDTGSSGFDIGTTGQAITFETKTFNHQGTSDVGGLNFLQHSYELGNGTDAISIKGLGYVFGFGSFHDNVTLDGPLQGYGFQPNASSGVTFTTNAYINAFYDYANIDTTVPGYNSFASGPQISGIQNNSNYTGLINNANITTFNGNSNYTGIGIYPTLGTFGTGSFNGIQINPTVTSVVNATGLYINMDNVTASGTKRAMEVKGNVSIDGSLSFTGALSIGQLQAFYSSNPVDGGGNPLNMHGLTTQMVGLNGVTTANCDAIGVNTAMLISLEANSINTSGSFGLGFTALALPCVVETHTGSSLDFMSGATYAINLVGTSTGGTIDRVNLCRALAIPNGITTINELVGFLAEAPFGDVGTDSWGFYAASANANNYFANHVRIGAGSDKVSNSQALEVVGTVQLNGDIGFFGTTEAPQQTGGAATAGATYTATEQTMLQVVYDALRTYGLLT